MFLLGLFYTTKNINKYWNNEVVFNFGSFFPEIFRVWLFGCKGDGCEDIHDEIDPEELDNCERT